MKKSKWKAVIIPGIICVIILVASIWYSVKFNESRLVVPTDIETYQFSPKDLPMICSIVLTIAYVWYLMIYIGKTSRHQKKAVFETNRTRKINPKLGFLGFLGFMGFAGFWTYSTDGRISPFMYFAFFGFFGFFYEGKMSGTFMDERFKENADRARFKALKTAFSLILAAFFLLEFGRHFMIISLEHMFIMLYIVIALSIALVMFLNEYLLYRYDHDEYAIYEYSEERDEGKNDNEE